MITQFFSDLIKAYGALYLASGGFSGLLLFAATMIEPKQGLIGLAGGATALLFRRCLKIPEAPRNIDVMNAVFVSLALASIYQASVHLIVLVLISSCISILVGRLIQNTLRDKVGLPVLSLPFVLMTWMVLPVSTKLDLSPHHYFVELPNAFLGASEHLLQAFGALYFNPNWVAGSVVLLGFLLLSPILCCLGLFGYFLAELTLYALSNNASPSLQLTAGYNGIVTAMVIGGIFAVPVKKHLITTSLAVILATFFASAASILLAVFWLPVLSAPFIASSYLILLVFRNSEPLDWAIYFLPEAALPEKTLIRFQQNEVRGLCHYSFGVLAPFHGSWHVYQSFNGKYTHRGLWRYGLDFFKIIDGMSFTASGMELDDYYCFGEDICSPVYGRVVACRDDIDDNPPGYVNSVDNWGNYVIITVGGGFYVLLAHLQKNSLKIKNGTLVMPGVVLGKCGNSGRSIQPHLHMQVQKTLDLGAPTFPFHLTHVLLNNDEQIEFSLNLIPREMQTVAPALAGTNLKEALRPIVGTTFSFLVTEGSNKSTWDFSLDIDPIGQLYLRTEKNACILLFTTEILTALANRSGPADPLFDALILGIGLTPYVEKPISWRDAQPIHLMPLSFIHRALVRITHPFGGVLTSLYQRDWSQEKKLWVQRGIHSIHAFGFKIAEMKTEVELCEGSGITGFSFSYPGAPPITAQLIRVTQREDLGILEKSLEVVSSEEDKQKNSLDFLHKPQ